MDAFLAACPSAPGVTPLLTGVGPVEAAMQVTAFLARTTEPVAGVVNFGVAGAYVRETGGAALLDICVADCEVLGDLGICAGDGIEPLAGEALVVFDTFPLDSPLLRKAITVLERAAIPFHRGPFVTVSCVSGSVRRGLMLTQRHQALCENMEGAAVARVCRRFSLPLLELRCMSNLVEDRDTQQWRLGDACHRCGQVVALVVQGLLPHA